MMALILIALLLAAAALTLVLVTLMLATLVLVTLALVTLIAVTGAAFCNALKTLMTPLPPQNSALLPVQGILQSVWFLVNSPAT